MEFIRRRLGDITAQISKFGASLANAQPKPEDKIRQLEHKLRDLGAIIESYRDAPELQEPVVREYHQTMQAMWDLGWNSSLDIEDELPDELMPERYVREYPRTDYYFKVLYKREELRGELKNLATRYREHEGDPAAQTIIVKEYNQIMEEMWGYRWSGYRGYLDPASELPDELMPERYIRERPPSYKEMLHKREELKGQLRDLATRYREHEGDPTAQAVTVKEYHQVLEELWNLGWSDTQDRLDPASVLPKGLNVPKRPPRN